jgi:hypothetical protein
MEILRSFFISVGFATGVAAPTWGDVTVDVDSAAQADWRTFMVQHPMPAEGCFQATYPSTVWKRVACKANPPHVHPTPVRSTADQEDARKASAH